MREVPIKRDAMTWQPHIVMLYFPSILSRAS
jgi:hypothetical protein